MPSTKSPAEVNPGPGKLSAGQVPASALLFSVGTGGGGDVQSHILNPIDAHMSSAIGVPEINPTTGQPLLASAGGPYDGENVMDVLTTLADLLPVRPDRIGYNASSVPNSGLPTWPNALVVGASAIKGGFKSGSSAIVTKYLTPNASLGTHTTQGVVFPADRGVLAYYHTNGNDFFNPAQTQLVAALWLGASSSAPVGIPSASFVEANRTTGQTDYTPSGVGIDRVTLIDRLPYLNAYPGAEYSPYSMNFYSYQLGKYSFPISITSGISGSYLLVHWRETYATNLTAIEPSSLTAGTLVAANCYSAAPSDLTAYDSVLRANVFLDTQSASGPTGQTITTAPAGTQTTAYLSGIKYFSSPGLQINITSTASNVFSNSFLTNTVASGSVPSGFESALPLVQADMSGLRGSTYPYPLFDGSNVDNGSGTPYTIGNPPDTTSVARFFHTTHPTYTGSAPYPKPVYPHGQVVVRWRGAFSSPVNATSSELYLCNLAFNEATLTSETKESFVSETYRYISTYSASVAGVPVVPLGPNVYSSSSAVGDYDLQLLSGQLVYPGINFNSGEYHPTQDVSRNYDTVRSSDPANRKRRYVRAFNTGVARNNGKIQLTGLAAAAFNASNTPDVNELTDHSGGAIVQIKIPGVTGWLDLGRSDGFPDNDKTQDFRGCKVGVVELGGVTTVTYSTGAFMTSPNSEGDYLLFVRVTFIKNGSGGEDSTLQGIDWLPPV